MTKYIAVMTFPTEATTYEAYAKLRATVGGLVLSAALVERNENGSTSFTEGDDQMLGAGTAAGSMIGLLVGALGGPIGLLLGTGAGFATGAIVDAARVDTADTVLEQYSLQVTPGTNAILAETSEDTTVPLDALVGEFGGVITRRTLDDVLAELELQQEATEAAEAAARKAIHEQKVAEVKQGFDDRVDALKLKAADAKSRQEAHLAAIKAKFHKAD